MEQADTGFADEAIPMVIEMAAINGTQCSARPGELNNMDTSFVPSARS